MRLAQIRDILEARVLAGEDGLDTEVSSACGSDLMSDVLAFIHRDALLLSGLINAQVIRTAEMADLTAVCFVRGKVPQKETVALAREKSIVLLATGLPMYEACGRLYKEGLQGCPIQQ